MTITVFDEQEKETLILRGPDNLSLKYFLKHDQINGDQKIIYSMFDTHNGQKLRTDTILVRV